MAKPKLKLGDPIIVTWQDAMGSASWEHIESLPTGPLLAQIGFFIKQDATGIYMASGIVVQGGCPHEGCQDVLGPSFVPSGCIRNIRRLR